jgi:hypothetical protein
MTEHICDGCGSTNNQQWIGPHPAGGWWHMDFCIPPPDWEPPAEWRSRNNNEGEDK